jgi:hypothetical protein
VYPSFQACFGEIFRWPPLPVLTVYDYTVQPVRHMDPFTQGEFWHPVWSIPGVCSPVYKHPDTACLYTYGTHVEGEVMHFAPSAQDFLCIWFDGRRKCFVKGLHSKLLMAGFC